MKYFVPVAVAIIECGITFPIWAVLLVIIPLSGTDAVIANLVLCISGISVMKTTWKKIITIFICGQCNEVFYSAHDLRSHYSSKHVKNEDENKDKTSS